MARLAGPAGLVVAGIVIGVVGARWSSRSAPESEAAPVAAPAVSPPPAPSPAVTADAAAVPVKPPVRVTTPATSMATAAAPVAELVPEAEYGGYTQPVDTGPVFRKLMAQKPPAGTENRLGDLHRALERELRDDSWAYPMEAELQNSLVAETSAGKLTVEHLECRATLCELRLSGNAANEQSLADWTAAAGRQPWASRLYMNLSSSISDGERVDGLLIFRRPGQEPRN